MIVGLGIDVCEIQRMRNALARHGDRFAARICTEAERGDFGRGDVAVSLSGRFAVKEAFIKATSGAPGVAWHDMEVRREPSGKPRLDLSGVALTLARGAGANRWHLSISHDAGVAVAVVVLERIEQPERGEP